MIYKKIYTLNASTNQETYTFCAFSTKRAAEKALFQMKNNYEDLKERCKAISFIMEDWYSFTALDKLINGNGDDVLVDIIIYNGDIKRDLVARTLDELCYNNILPKIVLNIINSSENKDFFNLISFFPKYFHLKEVSVLS